MRIELHHEARAEIREAAVWYEERRPRLGDDFVAAVSSMMERIESAPASFPPWPGILPARPERRSPDRPRPPIRRAVLQRFPCAVAFEVHSDHIRILAVAHTTRRPLYWIGRAH